MNIRHLLAFLALSVLQTFAVSVYAQTPPLNQIKIGACGNGTLDTLKKNEERRGLVIDVRPLAINQSTGILSFEGKTGRVSIVNMNPFIYKYSISVTQQELTTSAVTDFIDILLPPGLRIGSGANKAEDTKSQAGNRAAQKTVADSPIAQRLQHFDPANCRNPNDAGCVALKTMHAEFIQIRDALNVAKFDDRLTPRPAIQTFKTDIIALRNEELDATQTCTAAQALNTDLNVSKPGDYLDSLKGVNNAIKQISRQANDLSDLSDKYFEDNELKKYVVRCDGFNCATEFSDYAKAVVALLGLYSKDLGDLTATVGAMNQALELTDQMKNKDGVFGRTFDVIKKFELTEATVSVARTKIDSKTEAPAREADEEDGAKKVQSAHYSSVSRVMTQGDDTSKRHGDQLDDKEKDTKNSKEGNGLAPDINESIQIGRPRFLLSGGLVFSPLRRQTFDNVKGFVRDADRNPIGDGNKSVVGFSENSPRRLMPMVMLNTRLTSFEPTSLYFSLGVTAKHDDNVDVEYLLGPSFSLLKERALFTFGGYVGKVQRLVPDVKIGDEVPADAGDAKLFTKRYSWKPGFSFTYVFSQNERRGESVSTGGGGTGGAGDVKNEIRIGGIPFNLAMGLAYTSLEERTYDEIVGYARDREGNLTNGQTLTRIVGLTSSSGYRLAPLVLLHSRLFDFGTHSFYFSTGVTAKKSDDNLEIEYLLGGTVNAYRRKIFVTFGAFAGKQPVLGGDFFLGAKLDKDQNVTTTTRYLWKPGFAISYDISKILKRDSH